MTDSNVSLLFIPDISGFTDFIHQTEIKHSQHIISELLEIMIDANELGMELAEIEGDALFFYKFQNIPSVDELVMQVKRIYLSFHQHLRLYENRRICQCGACTSAESLELKFVVHGGEFDFIHVKGKQKPIGESVITVHRLLKNKVSSNEYLLITKTLLNKLPGNIEDDWHLLSDSYDHIGEIEYVFKELSFMRNELPELPEIVVDNIRNPLTIEFETRINAKSLDVYEMLTNFNFRRLWTKSLQDIDFNKKEINQAGTRHTCVINDKKINFESLRDAGSKGKWVYGEQTRDIPLMKRVNTYHTLTPVDSETTVSTKIFLEPANVLGNLMFIFIKKKLKESFSSGIKDLKELAENNSLDELYKMAV